MKESADEARAFSRAASSENSRSAGGADLPRRDEWGEDLDERTSRTTLGEFLESNGEKLRTAQGTIRHFHAKGTAETYRADRADSSVASCRKSLPY